MKFLPIWCVIVIAAVAPPLWKWSVSDAVDEIGVVAAQVDPVPSSYAEVGAAYTALAEDARERGSTAVERFLSQDFAALRAQFSPETAEALSAEILEQTAAQINAQPVGEKISERVLPIGGMTTYMVTYAWGETTLTLSVYFDTSGQIVGLNAVPDQPLPDDPALEYASETLFQLPFTGVWYTAWGGSDRLHNYHVDAPPQRHAYDFVVWQGGSTFSGEGTQNEDYYAYGQPALAPASGTVIAVVDDLPENQPQVETDEQHPAGNHVVIQTAEAEFVFLAHLQPGSITVEPGQTVESSQPIGLVGNSGNTSEPHLHIHLQDQPELFVTDDSGQATGFTDALGLPLVFSNYLENGILIENGEPVGGTFVQNE
mgnify:CR=1 FL=1